MNTIFKKSSLLRYEMIVWDWDGTIMNSTPTIVECLQKACVDLGEKVPNQEQASHVIGLGLHESIHYLLPHLPEKKYPLMLERFRHYYLGVDHKLVLFPGIMELIQALKTKGHLVAVATGKPRQGLDRTLKMHQLEGFFHDTKTADESRAKPHPQMLQELMDSWRVPANKMLMIGDTTHDLQMAKSAGVDSIAVTYGAHSKEKLQTLEPLLCVETVQELQSYLFKISVI